MDNLKLLKTFTLIGGIYEILFGFLLLFFIVPLFTTLGVSNPDINFPIFNQTAGLLAIIFGILLAISSIDIERYLLIPVMSVVLRIAIQFVIFLNVPAIPEMTIGLIAFALIDLIFGILTVILIKKCGFNVRQIFKK